MTLLLEEVLDLAAATLIPIVLFRGPCTDTRSKGMIRSLCILVSPFDPITIGHEYIKHRSLHDRIVFLAARDDALLRSAGVDRESAQALSVQLSALRI